MVGLGPVRNGTGWIPLFLVNLSFKFHSSSAVHCGVVDPKGLPSPGGLAAPLVVGSHPDSSIAGKPNAKTGPHSIGMGRKTGSA